ncbi:MAG: GyrI-like domain-containing protein [Ginsengibacter sp.]|jgi:predicted transcriptional regulator YdeE
MTNGFKLIGISTRTTNKNNQAATELQKLWGNFFAENILERIPNKQSNEIYAIYTDYKSDFTDEYTTIIGVPVSSLNDIPEGLIGREFEAQNFQTFTAKGKMPDAVVATWMDIWKRDKELNRSYTYDLEIYGERSQDKNNPEVDIYIAVKS